MSIAAAVLLVDLSDGGALGIAAELEAAGLSVVLETSVQRLGVRLRGPVGALIIAHQDDQGSVEGVRAAMQQARPDLPVLELSLSSRPSRTAVQEMANRVREALQRPSAPEVLPLDILPNRHLGLLIGESTLMREVCSTITTIAPTSVSVLIHGESGTGKELVAQAIHEQSCRRSGPLVRVNCAALPTALLESELFGHQRGAFTGAVQDRAGRFEAASDGTLFLDEIDSAEPGVQSKLLRIIERKEFERLGDNRTRRADVRILAATNADLPALARKGRFRPDLYYRLAAIELRLPPLRTRSEDLLLLAADAVRRLNREVGRSVQAIEGAALERLLSHRWPGNVRELGNVLCRSLLACEGRVLTVEHLPPGLGRTMAEIGAPQPADELREAISSFLSGVQNDLYRRVIDETERQLLGLVLCEHNGNIRRASNALGIARNTLKERIRRFDLHTADRSLGG